MGLQPDLIRESLNLVVEREPGITRRFYEILFDRYPRVAPLFGKESSEKQQQMLQEALVAVVDHIEDAAWLEQTLSGMGRQHVDYGVADFMYPWVKECLLATLEEIGAEDWRPAYAQAWSHALDAIAAQMLEGAAQRRAEDARAERKSKSR